MLSDSYKALIWIVFVALAVGMYKLASWLRVKNRNAVWIGLLLLVIVDLVIGLNFPATPDASNFAATFVIAGTGGYLCAALTEPVRTFAAWLEKIGFRP